MPGPSQQQDSITLEEFKHLLHTKWTFKVACQNDCDPPDNCTCLRHIVHVDALAAWWKRTASESTTQSKLQRLLEELPQGDHRLFPLDQRQFTGEHSCLRVFSLLLKQGRGHLVDRFYESDMHDKYLEIPRTESNRGLRDNLKQTKHRDEVDTIITDFQREKWAYCPLKLTLHMDRNLTGTNVIPPFCHKVKLGDKGGTASLYWVAIQKEFVSEAALISVLQDSLYTDEEYGECYQMVLKSYCGNKRDAYGLEKEAFTGLQSNEQVPIVRYLGCYTHDYGEGSQMGRTYNLLLEYGERDLYDYWSDERSVPPVRAYEIIRTWKSLFDVAGAIHHVHHLEVPRGRSAPLKFHGWHADIKPDNILMVRGQLKLADFGFSRFARAVQQHNNGSVPTELIQGFTDAYGAPEVSRMKRADGTLSGVTQSIDTWSFGCVLSVAATWIVLGFQGIRQYEQLRKLTPANKKGDITYDRFHDGFVVLPEIRKWHDYLRGHLRPSDTTTSLVLDLVEHDMLQADPSLRISLEDLCPKLSDLLKYAEKKIEDLKRALKKTDEIVLQALLSIERQAEIQKSSERKASPLQQQSVALESMQRLNPRQRASRQIRKEDFIRSKPLGQTPHRRELLEEELNIPRFIAEDPVPFANDGHNGAITDSPTHTTPPINNFVDRRTYHDRLHRGIPRSDVAATDEGKASSAQTQDIPTINLPQTYSQRSRNGHVIASNTDIHMRNGALTYPSETSTGSREVEHLAPQAPDSPSIRSSNMVPQRVVSPKSTENYTKSERSAPSTPVSMARGSPSTNENVVPNFPSPIGTVANPMEPLLMNSMQHQTSYVDNVPRLSHPKPEGSHFHTGRTYKPAYSEQPKSSADGTTSAASQPPSTLYDGLHTAEKEAVPSDHHDDYSTSAAVILLPLPQSIYDLPYDICSKRQELDRDVQKLSAKLKGVFGRETRRRDPALVDTFSAQRELILVIDNGTTMFKHWPIAVFVAETLAKNAAGLDRSGVDVRFTIDGHKHNKKDLRGDSGRETLKKALKAAWPDNTPHTSSSTDMARVLDEIRREWSQTGRRATTLLVLTDGVWSNTNDRDLEETILSIAEHDQQHAGNRHFSIQFIRFGDDDVQHKQKLERLDDKLCQEKGLRDIIDHCSWRTTVGKMFKGSIEGFHDEEDPNEIPIQYDYTSLVALFKAFNEGLAVNSPNFLSPTPGPRRTLSRSSSRSSNSGPRWRDSAPAGPAAPLQRRPSHSRTPFSA